MSGTDIQGCVNGAGSWGTTVATLASLNTPTVLWARRAELADEINREHRNEAYLPGYDGTINLASLSWLLFKMVVVLYLVASALSHHDKSSLSVFGIALRVILAILILLKISVIANSALVVAGLYLAYHHFGDRQFLARDQAP